MNLYGTEKLTKTRLRIRDVFSNSKAAHSAVLLELLQDTAFDCPCEMHVFGHLANVSLEQWVNKRVTAKEAEIGVDVALNCVELTRHRKTEQDQIKDMKSLLKLQISTVGVVIRVITGYCV